MRFQNIRATHLVWNTQHVEFGFVCFFSLNLVYRSQSVTESVTNMVTKPKPNEVINLSLGFQIMETYRYISKCSVWFFFWNGKNRLSLSYEYVMFKFTCLLSFYGRITDYLFCFFVFVLHEFSMAWTSGCRHISCVALPRATDNSDPCLQCLTHCSY